MDKRSRQTQGRTWAMLASIAAVFGSLVLPATAEAQDKGTPLQCSLYAVQAGDERAFTGRKPADLGVPVVRGPQTLVVVISFGLRPEPQQTAGLDRSPVDPDFAQKSPIFGTHVADWRAFLRLELANSEGSVMPHEEVSLEWVRFPRPDPGSSVLRFYSMLKDGTNGWPRRMSIHGFVRLTPARGGVFPDGRYQIRARYDTVGNVAGLHPFRVEGRSAWFEIRAARTELEKLEARYQDAMLRWTVYEDAAGASAILKEILKQRPDSACVLRQLSGFLETQGQYAEALACARRYQEIYEKGLDPTWFSAQQFRKLDEERRVEHLPDLWDLKKDITRLEILIEEKRRGEKR